MTFLILLYSVFGEPMAKCAKKVTHKQINVIWLVVFVDDSQLCCIIFT